MARRAASRPQEAKVEQVFNLKYHDDAEHYFDLLAMMSAQKIKFSVKNNGPLRIIEVGERYAYLFDAQPAAINILKPAELMMQA